MSLLLSRLWKLRLGKPTLVRRRRRCSLLPSNGFSSSSLQTPPYSIYWANPCGADLGKLVFSNPDGSDPTHLDKKVPLELMNEMGTIGASHGWIATLNQEDGILRLQDDLNPNASGTHPKRIPLPPLVTLPHCQTQFVTNVSMSTSSPEDEDCVVAVKFLGPQMSFCRPAQSNSQWTNARLVNPCFHSSRVMFSEKDQMFRIPGSGGHLIGSWDLRKLKNKPKFHKLRYKNLPEFTKAKLELMDSCWRTEHLVESRTTGETFLVKWYRKIAGREVVTWTDVVSDIAKMKTKELMVFKLDGEGNALYTKDIGDLCIFLSKSEPFCVPGSSVPGMRSNAVNILDAGESGIVSLYSSLIISETYPLDAPYHIPPQNVD